MDDFDRGKLSSRENEILEHAIAGQTDQQIGQQLGISSSTVNSYWVRIRGKLGSKSRTELVARALRLEASEEMSELRKRSNDFESQLTDQKASAEHIALAEMFHRALDALPEAVLVRDKVGRIIYTNELLDAMFGYERGSLVDQPMDVLVPPDGRNIQPNIAAWVALDKPVRFGIDRVLYARNSRGHYFRVILLLRSQPTRQGPITTCIFRSFVSEVDDLQRHIQSAAEGRAGFSARHRIAAVKLDEISDALLAHTPPPE